MTVLLHLFFCLLLTIVTEGLTALLLKRRWYIVYVTVLCNVLTNPVLNFLLLLIVRWRPALYMPLLALLEVIAVAVEGYTMHRLVPLSRFRALCFSLLLNAVSFGTGLLMNSVSGGLL
ncbi:MAG: hypothetical protein ACI4MR_01940 [Candidatus Aphodomorpha sp.]